MANVTQILDQLSRGQGSASSDLLPIIYDELHRLAAHRLASERKSPSIQPTLLVHEAYLRLVDQDQEQRWRGRGHFFGAAAEAMRRILVEHARRRKTLKRGGDYERVSLEFAEPTTPAKEVIDLIALDEVLQQFEAKWPDKAKLVKLRYFAGMTTTEAATAMEISESTAERYWKFARAWLYARLHNT